MAQAEEIESSSWPFPESNSDTCMVSVFALIWIVSAVKCENGSARPSPHRHDQTLESLSCEFPVVAESRSVENKSKLSHPVVLNLLNILNL